MTAPLCRWCTTFCMNVDDCDGQQQWMAYWEQLTPEQRKDELRSMDNYTAEYQDDRA